METALNPTNLPQEPSGQRAEGEVTCDARSGGREIALQGCLISPAGTGAGCPPDCPPADRPRSRAYPLYCLPQPLPVFSFAQPDGNYPVEVHLRSDPDDARAMTGPAGVAPRGNQPWSSHRRKPLRSGKRRRKRKWQRHKEPWSSTEGQSARFLPAAVQVRGRAGAEGTRPGGGNLALSIQRHGSAQ